MKRLCAEGLRSASLLLALLSSGNAELRLIPAPRDQAATNLLPNPSFEKTLDGQAEGWLFQARNTTATFKLAEGGRSGRYALRITNGTPYGPHVYGQAVLETPLSLEPGKTYTLSAYARSLDPGKAWVGGGHGWWLRMGLSGTEGKWKRFTKTFVARQDDTGFPFMVNTDSPTLWFEVDDLKIEEGHAATPFLVEDGGRPEIWLELDIQEEVSVQAETASFAASISVPEGERFRRCGATISQRDGPYRESAVLEESLSSGTHGLRLLWSLPEEQGHLYRCVLKADGAKVAKDFSLFASHHFETSLRRALNAKERLSLFLQEAENKGLEPRYARAALAVASRFTRVAEKKKEAGRIKDACGDLDYLAELCEEQSLRLERLLLGEERLMYVPDPSLDGLTVRDGSFYAGDRPVVLLGALGYGELLNELPSYKDYGFNVIGDDFNSYSAFRMLTGENQFDPEAIPKLLRSWDRLEALNLAIAYNPTLHYFPEWALRRYRDITGGDKVDALPDWSGLGRHAGKSTKTYGSFFPFAIDSPNLRRLVSQYYGELMPALEGHDAFHAIWLMNEPTYHSEDTRTLNLYRSYLREKFKNIKELNAKWGGEYASFQKIEPPRRPDDPGRFDWLAFHQDAVSGWFEWLAAEIKQHHPKALLSNKPMAWTLFEPERGVDFEREALLWEIPGCDAGRSPKSNDYAFGWETAAVLFDFQKSVAPDKPLADHEFHYVHEPDVSSEYVRACYFHSALHGLRMSQFWVWATGELGTGQAGAGMKHTAWSQPKVAWGTATSALDLRRLSDVVCAFPGPHEAALYLSRPSLYVDHSRHKRALMHAYEAMNGLDAPIGFVTDRMIREGDLPKLSLLVVPQARHVESDVLDGILRFHAQGGWIVLLGDEQDCLALDPYGAAHAKTLSSEQERVRFIQDDKPGDLVEAMDSAFDEAHVARPIRLRPLRGESAWPVECRSLQVGGEWICSVVGLNKTPITVSLEGSLEGPGKVRGWKNLITGQRHRGRRLTVHPLDVYLLELQLS